MCHMNIFSVETVKEQKIHHHFRHVGLWQFTDWKMSESVEIYQFFITDTTRNLFHSNNCIEQILLTFVMCVTGGRHQQKPSCTTWRMPRNWRCMVWTSTLPRTVREWTWCWACAPQVSLYTVTSEFPYS